MKALVTKEEILKALEGVVDPELGLSIIELNMVKELKIQGKKVELKVALTVPSCPLATTIKEDVVKAVKAIEGIDEVNVELGSMSRDELEELKERLRTRSEKARQKAQKGFEKLDKRGIRRMVAIVSGKGGVGKSFVTAMLASELRRQGYEVGVLDADVTGPSIAKVFGLRGKPKLGERGIVPALSKTGIKIISINLLLDNPELPTIWRGPIINSVIKQLYTEVDWGDLHYLLVDLPPGTSDAPLTVFQSLPLDGVVVVTTPQDLALMVVAKAVNMAKMMNVPILGLVENMGYIRCPRCGEMIEPFGHHSRDEVSKRLSAPLLGVLPLDPKIAELTDEGRVEEYSNSSTSEIGKRFKQALPLTYESPTDVPIAWKKEDEAK